MATTASVSVLAGQLRLAVVRTNRRLRQEAGGGLRPTMTAPLATIERHRPPAAAGPPPRERIQRPPAPRLIGRLEADGLMVRTPDPADGRSSLMTTSAAGRRLLRENRTRKDAYLARRLRRLSAEDRATLERAAVLLEQ